jgi:methylthioribose-1-phosphate isomerase
LPNPLFHKTITWSGGLDGVVELIDQTLLPGKFEIKACRTIEEIWEAIRSLRVRGAPAIGVTAAMGVVVGVREASDHDAFFEKLETVCTYLGGSRPTAVNLFWALDRMRRVAEDARALPLQALKQRLLDEALAIRDEDAATCRAMGEVGESLIPEGSSVLTHCNAGSLATAEFGTALAPLYTAHAMGRRFQVYADETRPLLQGARLTAWELCEAGIEVTVICDSMAGQLMQAGKIDVVITGADRIARNGDTANKIGTYSLAVLCRAHGLPFYVVAPRSTFDLSIPDGGAIPIEMRPSEEIRSGFGQVTVPERAACYNPAFDVTPAELISGIVTEKGFIHPVTEENISRIYRIDTCKEDKSQ